MSEFHMTMFDSLRQIFRLSFSTQKSGFHERPVSFTMPSLTLQTRYGQPKIYVPLKSRVKEMDTEKLKELQRYR
jgi:hypothetical protein